MRITISRSLLAFGVVLISVFSASLGILAYTLNELKIGGKDYARIIDAKDLIADILPPPLASTEPFLLATELVASPDRAATLVPQIEALRQMYEASKARWSVTDLSPDMNAAIRDKLEPVNARFWSVMQDGFLPAVKTQDTAAMSDGLKRMHDALDQQKLEIAALVKMATQNLADSEGIAADRAALLQTAAFATSGAAFVVLLGGLYIFRRRAITPLSHVSHYMSALSGGDFDTEVPFMRRSDEIGDMAKSVAVFRQAGLDKLRLEEENRARNLSEAAAREAIAAAKAEEAALLQKVVTDLGAGLDRLSKFNIRMTLDEPFEPQFEQLRHDFNKSLAAFQTTMSEVLEKSREIEANADTLQQSSDQLAKRTEQQAAALEQTAAALEQITTNIKQSSQRTAATRHKAQDARQTVGRSADVVQQAIQAMQRIEEASGQIGNITNVIDEIAFQTNLLALNAGVEAARAGEAGKGFAVVAQEVRELAQRSATAAKEIKALIERSGQEVAGGVDLVKRTGTALGDIETSITGIAGDVEQIALAANEQSVGLSEVNVAINQMDQLTQQNAAMVEETTAATHSLAQEVGTLVGLVGQFVFNRRAAVRDTPADKAKTQTLRNTSAAQSRHAA